MSFTTGRAQRRGTQSATVGVNYRNVSGSTTSYPSSDLIKQPKGPLRATGKKRKVASVGNDNASGLVILGRHDFDSFEGTDPDNAVPPLEGDTLRNPDFPISYNGRGTLKFVSPIRITTIDGPLNVNGEVYSSSGLLGPAFGGGLVTVTAPWESGMTMGATGAGANLTIDGPNTYCTANTAADNVNLHVHITWTSKGAVLDGDEIFIKGLPYNNEAQPQVGFAHCTNVFPTQLGSYFFIRNTPSDTQIQLFSCDAGTGIEVPVTGVQLNSSGTISFNMNYHGIVP